MEEDGESEANQSQDSGMSVDELQQEPSFDSNGEKVSKMVNSKVKE